MAEEEDTPLRTEEEGEEESGSESSEDEQVEWLVTTREKRSTAGNRMHSLLQQEEPDDDLELLFAEAEDDVGFSDVEDGSDVQMDSSSDEEDQGPVAGDDLEGEKELQKQAKAEAKKRKKGPIPKIFKKRVKIDPTISTAPPPRPKKKSERASWLPTAEDAPIRSSSRDTTKAQKEALHAQMVDREIKRLRVLANMASAEAKKAADKKPDLTQEDRLKEAARVEKANAKSLSRWEQAENEREEEQRLKHAALHNRTLTGPVLTYWSGMAEYIGGKLKRVGKVVIEEVEKPMKKRKAAQMEGESEAGSAAGATPAPDGASEITKTAIDITPNPSEPTSNSPDVAVPDTDAPNIPPSLLLNGIPTHSNGKSNIPPPLPTITAPLHPPLPPPTSSVLAPPSGFALFAPPHIPFAQPSRDGSHLGYGYPHQRLMPSPAAPYSYISTPPPPLPPPQPALPPAPPAIEHTLRKAIIFENFDETAIKNKDVQIQVLFGHKFEKLQKPRHSSKLHTCAITGYPAKYRDPATGLPYCNAYAFKEIQRLKRGEYKWSKLVGAYVGLGTYAARGVPERFIVNAGGEK